MMSQSFVRHAEQPKLFNEIGFYPAGMLWCYVKAKNEDDISRNRLQLSKISYDIECEVKYDSNHGSRKYNPVKKINRA